MDIKREDFGRLPGKLIELVATESDGGKADLVDLIAAIDDAFGSWGMTFVLLDRVLEMVEEHDTKIGLDRVLLIKELREQIADDIDYYEEDE